MLTLLQFVFGVIALRKYVTGAMIHKDLCSETNNQAIQCQAILNSDRLPKNSECDPVNKKDCQLNDLISNKIASCTLKIPKEYLYRPYARCRPEVKQSYPSLKNIRIVAASHGDPSCVPVKFSKQVICGEKGTRCVCDTGDPKAKSNLIDIEELHACRCQWFLDYCSISDACSASSTSCKTTDDSGLQCIGGSINQCIVNPTLCQNQNTYCVELDDQNQKWRVGHEHVGDGFSCVDKQSFRQIANNAPFCNFDKTDHIVKVGAGFQKPGSNLDYCCYQHLVCTQHPEEIGGYLFKNRPCHCNIEFRKCLLKLEIDFSLWSHARVLLSIVEHVKVCSIDDTGKCNPLQPASCSKGDLIDPSIAHCKINCKTGPLLPIEFRSCRIRKCIPPNNLKHSRVIDVTNHIESSRCEAVRGLTIDCGMKQTRCVCDGLPNSPYFTDGCRCQYWPE